MVQAGDRLTKPRRRDRLRALLTSKSLDSSSTAAPSTQILPGQQDPAVTSFTSQSALSSSNVPLRPAAVAAASTGSQQLLASPAIENELLQRALGKLSSDKHETIASLAPANNDVRTVLAEALSAAVKQRKLCDEKRWTIAFRGREVVLRQLADRVVRWIDRVKFAGDIVANADPVHAGLPWAGIRLLLEAATADSKQRAAILDGCDTALYVADRLKVYLEYTHTVPPSQALDNLKTTLTEIYACVLEFLAKAVMAYRTNAFQRTLTAMWTANDIQDFDGRCRQLRNRAHEDASACERLLSSHDRSLNSVGRQAVTNLLEELRKWRATEHTVQNIETQMYLNKIPYAPGAMFNSSSNSNLTCHPETRVDLLRRIMDWSQDIQGKSIFWLQGKAGTGKSTISRTVAQKLDANDQLGASFFFRRGEQARGTALRFFPTIVHQLSIKMPEYSNHVAAAIREDPLIFDKAIHEQFDKLLSRPISLLNDAHGDGRTVFIVVDALDECENSQDVRTIITLWSRLFQATTTSFRLFVTSRPESVIRTGFKKVSLTYHQDVDLHEIPETVTRNDLLVFLRADFAYFQEEYDLEPAGAALGTAWPGEEVLCKLVAIAHPLFIVAATISRFIQDPNCHPRRQLEVMLTTAKTGRFSHMEQTYRAVLEQLPATLSDLNGVEALYEDFCETVGTTVCVAEPLSISALAALLSKNQDLVETRLQPLHSVLCIPTNDREPVRPLHLSFTEFLIDEKTQSLPFGINEKAMHKCLFAKCLQLLSGPRGLHANICDLEHAGMLRRDVDLATISDHLSEAMQYACCYWTHHLQKTEAQLQDNDQTHQFLRVHLLHWLEAMSLTNKIFDCISLIVSLQRLVVPSVAPQLHALLQDARRFILANSEQLDQAPLQIYSSAVFFLPDSSAVKRTFQKSLDGFRISFKAPEYWGSRLTTLHCGNSAHILSFSRDGCLLAAATALNVLIWDVGTGKQLQTNTCDIFGIPTAMTFSGDAKYLMMTSAYEIACLELATGIWTNNISTKIPPRSSVFSIQTAPDGRLKAGVIMKSAKDTVAHVSTIDLENGDCIHLFDDTFEAYQVNLTLSSCSSLVAILPQALEKTRVQIRSTKDGTAPPSSSVLDSFLSEAICMAFSHSTDVVAIGQFMDIILLDRETGRLLKALRPHEPAVFSVAFSPDDSVLASGSPGLVELWDLKSELVSSMSDEQGTEELPKRIMCHSYDGRFVAQAPGNLPLVELWEINSWTMAKLIPYSGKSPPHIVFSPNGEFFAVSTDDSISVWCTDTWKELVTLSDARLPVCDSSPFSYDGQFLLVLRLSIRFTSDNEPKEEKTSLDNDKVPNRCSEFIIWDIVHRTETLLETNKDNDFVLKAAFSSDNHYFAWDRPAFQGASSKFKQISVWDLGIGERVAMFDPNCHGISDPELEALTFTSSQEAILLRYHGFDHSGWQVTLWNWQHNATLPICFTSDVPRCFSLLNAGLIDNSVNTNAGTFIINQDSGRAICKRVGLGLSEKWITYGDRNILWIPIRYRPVRSAVCDDTVVLVTKDDEIITFKIDIAAIDKGWHKNRITSE